MILTDLLETSHFPRLKTRRALQREFKNFKKSVQRFAKAQTRKARSKALATYRRQYLLSNAFVDSQRAIKQNEDIFIAGLLAVFILLFSSLNTAMNFMLLFLGTAYEIATFTGISMALLMLIVGGVVGILSAWIIAFLLNMLSLTTMEGATHKVKRSARATARKSMALAGRVTTAWILLGALAFIPVGVTILTILWLLRIDAITFAGLLQNLAIITTACVAYIVTILMNFALAPYVALFETSLDFKRVFSRSHDLVRRRGRLFNLLSYCVFGLALFTTFKASQLIDTILHLNIWLTFAAASLAIAVVANSIMVVFYRKRKLARVN